MAFATVAVALTLAACGQGPGAGDDPSSAAPTTEGDGNVAGSLASFNMTPIGGGFVNATDGSVVRAQCTRDGCTYQLLSTVDGGATWKASAVPGAPVMSAPLDDANAVVLPGGDVVVEIQVDGVDRLARHTTDQGQTWPAQRAAPTGVEDAVPSDGALVGFCAESVNCTEPVLRVIRKNGTSASYGPPPTGLAETVDAARVGDGALWVQGRDGNDRVMLAISNDNGSSWKVHRVPAPSAASVEIVGNGEVAWALALSDPESATTGGTGGTVPVQPGRKLRQSLLYSADGGATWTAVKLPEDYRLNTGSGIGVTTGGAAVIAADGKVAMVAPDGTLTEVNAVHGAAYNLGKRVLVYSGTGSWVTADGQSWTPLPN